MADLAATPDGLPVRGVGLWTLEKLATLLLYLPAYAAACRSVGGGFYVDGFAGPGIAKVRRAQEEPRYVWGSPLIALRSDPRLQKCILFELGRGKVSTLQQRCTQFGARATVHSGDVNQELVTVVLDEVPGWAPCFCFLDPEGFELHWQTVRQLATLPRTRKPELMILFPLEMSVLRVLTVTKPMRDEDHERVSRMFSDDAWWDVYQARVRGEIDPADAKRLYVDFYTKDIESLGYASVVSRPVLAYVGAGRKRQARYHLIFATDHPVGEDIMADIFRRPFVLDFPVSRQRPLFED